MPRTEPRSLWTAQRILLPAACTIATGDASRTLTLPCTPSDLVNATRTPIQLRRLVISTTNQTFAAVRQGAVAERYQDLRFGVAGFKRMRLHLGVLGSAALGPTSVLVGTLLPVPNGAPIARDSTRAGLYSVSKLGFDQALEAGTVVEMDVSPPAAEDAALRGGTTLRITTGVGEGQSARIVQAETTAQPGSLQPVSAQAPNLYTPPAITRLPIEAEAVLRYTAGADVLGSPGAYTRWLNRGTWGADFDLVPAPAPHTQEDSLLEERTTIEGYFILGGYPTVRNVLWRSPEFGTTGPGFTLVLACFPFESDMIARLQRFDLNETRNHRVVSASAVVGEAAGDVVMLTNYFDANMDTDIFHPNFVRWVEPTDPASLNTYKRPGYILGLSHLASGDITHFLSGDPILDSADPTYVTIDLRMRLQDQLQLDKRSWFSEVQYYNRALTLSELEELLDALRARHASLIPAMLPVQVAAAPALSMSASDYVRESAGREDKVQSLQIAIDQVGYAADVLAANQTALPAVVADASLNLGVSARTQGQDWWRPNAPAALVLDRLTPALTYELPVPIVLAPGEGLDVAIEIPLPYLPDRDLDLVAGEFLGQLGIAFNGVALIET